MFEISQSMWSVFYMIYEAFQKDAFDYFAGKVSSKGLLMLLEKNVENRDKIVSVAPYLRKCGNLPIREILVIT